MDAFIDAAANLPLLDSQNETNKCLTEKLIESEKKLQEALCEIDRMKGDCQSGLCQMGSFDVSCLDTPEKKKK